MVDITPLELYNLIDKYYSRLEFNEYSKPSMLFKIAWYYYLSPKHLLTVKRFNKKAVSLLLEKIEFSYKKAIVHPGEKWLVL